MNILIIICVLLTLLVFFLLALITNRDARDSWKLIFMASTLIKSETLDPLIRAECLHILGGIEQTLLKSNSIFIMIDKRTGIDVSADINRTSIVYNHIEGIYRSRLDY